MAEEIEEKNEEQVASEQEESTESTESTEETQEEVQEETTETQEETQEETTKEVETESEETTEETSETKEDETGTEGQEEKVEEGQAESSTGDEQQQEEQAESVEEKPDLLTRVQAHFPDREITDENREESINEYVTDLEDYQDKGRTVNQALIQMFDREPKFAEIARECSKGERFEVALARHYDPEELIIPEGDPDHEQWKKNLEEGRKRSSENKNIIQGVQKNQGESLKVVEAFTEAKEYKNEQTVAFLGQIDELLADVYKGTITKEFLNIMHKGLNYDGAVKTAKEVGEIKGKNKKIDAFKSKKKTGDGLPVTKPTTEIDESKPVKDRMDSILEREKGRKVLE